MKLNLGCSEHKIDGYVNVDRHGSADVLHDIDYFLQASSQQKQLITSDTAMKRLEKNVTRALELKKQLVD